MGLRHLLEVAIIEKEEAESVNRRLLNSITKLKITNLRLTEKIERKNQKIQKLVEKIKNNA